MSWLGGCQMLATGRVVHYWTRESHEQDGWVFPKGSSCLATRAESGEVLLVFLTGPGNQDAGRACWLPANYGLCGVEPGVLDPDLCNMAMVNLAVQRAEARVNDEIRREREGNSGLAGAGLFVRPTVGTQTPSEGQVSPPDQRPPKRRRRST